MMMSPRQYPTAGRTSSAVMTMMTLLVAGCSGGNGHVSVQTTAVPPASPAQASASRIYLNGKGHGLVRLDELAGQVTNSHTRVVCRADQKSLVRLAKGHPEAVADPGLAELFSDEFSAFSSVLVHCTHDRVPASALSTLSSVHALVDQRLRADKAHL